LTFSTLEDDLRAAESDKSQFIAQESIILSLEEQSRQQSREVKDLELAQRVKDLEIATLKRRLDSLTDPVSVRAIEFQPPLNIDGMSVSLLSNLRESCHRIERKGLPTDEDVFAFLDAIPRRVRYTEEENHRLKVIGEQAKEKLEKLKAEVAVPDDSPPPEKLRQFAETLIVANRKLTEKIATLKGLAERQHLALQRCAGARNGVDQTLAASLRKLLEQLSSCPIAERPRFAELAERVLDAMIGVGT
jgi:hypothetical protein